MQIEAENCQGISSSTEVYGSCLVQHPQTTIQPAGSTSTIIIGVVVPIVLVAFLSLIVLVIIHRKR